MLLLSVKADSDNDIISIVLHLRTRLLHPQPESSTARGKESKLQKKKKAMTGQREEKKKRTRVQMQLLRRPHLCARSEVKPKAAKSCLQVVPKPPSWREQVEKVGFFLFFFRCVLKKKKKKNSLGAISSIKPAFSLSSLHSSRDAGDCGKNASSECSPDEE